MGNKNASKGLFKIKTASQAVAKLRWVSISLYLIAIVNVVISTYTGDISAAIDGWMIFSLALTLQHCHSRIIAILLVPYSLLIIASVMYCNYYALPNSRNIVLGIISLILGCYAIFATHAYHKIRESHINWRNGIIKTLQALAYGILFLFLTAFAIIIPFHIHLFNLGGHALPGLISLMLPTVGVFLAFNGWLPFTHNEPTCRYTR